MKNIAFVTYQKAPNLTPDDALAIKPLNEDTAAPKRFAEAVFQFMNFEANEPKKFTNGLKAANC